MIGKRLVRGGTTLSKGVKAFYEAGLDDYSLEPVILAGKDGKLTTEVSK